jgi:hypothetical protein
MSEPSGWEGPVRAAVSELKSGLVGHPTPDELLDYHGDDLGPETRERVEDHLALCADCARTVLDLGSFPAVEPVREADRLTSADIAAEWRRFAAQLPARPRARPRRFTAPVWAYALAAVFAAVAVGLGVWAWSLAGAVQRLSSPTASLHVADLVPLDAAVRAEGRAPAVVAIPRGSERLVLLLNVTTAEPLAAVGVELFGPDGRRVFAQQDLPPTSDGAYALDLPAKSLAPGAYRIALIARGKTVALYACEIRP